MHRRTFRGAGRLAVGVCALVALAGGFTGCSSSVAPAGAPATTAAAAPVYNAWTTPPRVGERYRAMPGQAAALQPAPQSIPAPTAMAQPRLQQWGPSGMPPPPPPPDPSLPVSGMPSGAYFAPAGATTPATAAAPCAPPAAPVASATRNVWTVPERSYSGCGLPCAQGISTWHVRPVVGYATFHGDDEGDPCTYWGLDVGRTFCGCWGLDLYYRYNSGQFIREPTPGVTFKDGGEWHHVGVKFTYDVPFGSGPFSGFAGIGAGYYWTDKYIANDDGPEIFLEAGVAWHLNRTWAVRGGVNIHGMDTKVTRRSPADDGKSRWLWIVAPVIELEARF